MQKALSKKIKSTKSQLSSKTRKVKKSAYSFGSIEECSYDELLGSERGEMLQAFGQVCYCGMYTSDPYNCSSSSCDSRC